jgi:hypothetical protein
MLGEAKLVQDVAKREWDQDLAWEIELVEDTCMDAEQV